MRVLVTGNEGYIGSVLCSLLVGAGHDVFGLDSGLFRDCATGPLPSVPTLRRDIRDVEAADFTRSDAVIHLAALSNDPLGDIDSDVTFAINHAAAVRVSECARRAGVRRFVFASSCSVYGAAGDRFLDESSPLDPLTPYAASKVQAERDIRALEAPGFRPVIMRPGTVYGSSARLRFDLVVNNLVAWATATGQVRLKSRGTAWRPLVHVADLARAFMMASSVSEDRLGPRVFNVGETSENYRIRTVAEMVCTGVEGSEIVVAPDAFHDERSYRVSCDRLESSFPEFRLKRNVASGIREIRALVHGLGLGPSDFEGPSYQRRAHIMRLREQGAVDDTFRRVTDPGSPDGQTLAPVAISR